MKPTYVRRQNYVPMTDPAQRSGDAKIDHGQAHHRNHNKHDFRHRLIPLRPSHVYVSLPQRPNGRFAAVTSGPRRTGREPVGDRGGSRPAQCPFSTTNRLS